MARRSRRADSDHRFSSWTTETDTLESVRTLLEHEGHRVHTATSGSEALELLKQSR
jgi:CheY-like chemotaxis protein